jgi:LPS-assembly protein
LTLPHIIAVLLVFGTAAGVPLYARGQELPKKVSITVTADKLDYDRTNDRYVAIGHVQIEQEGVRIEADQVTLNNKTGEVEAEGRVFMQDKEDSIHAEKLQVNLKTRDGIITSGDIYIKKGNLHVKGGRIDRQAETVYHVEQGTVTTCDENEWYLKADELNIDMDRYATGTGVTLNMAGVPVFYTPYFLFPVRRQTGLLIPEVGHSSRDGFVVGNAFFWAISDYKDMTIYSDYREKTGHGTGVEYRYQNSRDSSGQAYYKFWDMYHTGESRWDFRFQHSEEFAEDLSSRVDINLVSDEHYFYELDKKLENRSKPYLDSNAFYVERWNNAALYLMGQYSIDLTRTNEKTVQKLPELRYMIFDETIAGPLHLSFEGSAVNFTSQAEDGARRMDFNPRLSATLGTHGFSVTPRVGVRATFYDRSANTAEPTERRYMYTAVDVNARISRIYGVDGEEGIGRLRHSIEPTISYTYIPHVEQTNIPQFDSVDAVLAQDRVTASIINRVTAHYKETKDSPTYTTFDLMVFRLSQSYDYNEARRQDTATLHPRSEILGELFVQTPKVFSVSASGNYDTYNHVLSSHTEAAALTMNAVQLNLSHQYLRQPATEFLIGGGALKLDKWNLSAQWWRDVHNDKTTQEEYRMHYGSQCWGIGMSYIIKPGETQFMAMLDLKGIGGK